MDDAVDQLLSRGDIETAGPASRSKIDAVARQFDGLLPSLLPKLWRASDGVILCDLEAHIPGPSEALDLIAGDAWEQHWLERGFVPVLDDRQGSYLAAIVSDPCAFRIAHVPHDDKSRLIYRDFESCLYSLIQAMDSGVTDACMFLHESKGDYPPDTPRSEEDQDVARALMAGGNEDQAWNYAAQLLDASNLDEWAKLLETDHVVRGDVRARMQQMTSPAIHDLFEKDQKAFDEFAELTAIAVKKAGHNVGIRKNECLQVDGHWMNLEAFFYCRNMPNAMERVIAAVRSWRG